MSTMVIRVWQESTHENAFRARLTMSDAGGIDTSIVSADADEVLAAVRDWLAAQQLQQASRRTLPPDAPSALRA